MSGEDVRDVVRDFLRQHIESYEHLEVLLLLLCHADRSWTADSASHELRIGSPATTAALDHLRVHGLAAQADAAGGFRYNPETPCLHDAARALARTYEQDRLVVMELMTANSLERLRNAATRMFADAFRLRGPRKDG